MKIKAELITKSMNDCAKIVYCLDISCELMNIPFDESSGLRQASIRSKSSYQSNRKLLMKLLNLNKKMSISSLILKLGINNLNVEKNSKKILDSYAKQNPQADLDHPQYLVMSIYQSCKVEKVKVLKKNLVPLSNLKQNQWTMLEKSWDKWVGDVLKVNKNKENRQIHEIVDESPQKQKEKQLKRKQHAEPEEEEYDVWKKRILEAAYAELTVKSHK